MAEKHVGNFRCSKSDLEVKVTRSAFIPTDPTDEPITSRLPVTRPESALASVTSVSVVNGLDPITWFVYFFNPAVKFVTTVRDWLTCCGTRSRRIFLPSGDRS
jgi:hypothetical protein